jgi:uncharacterized protein YndB with AHSA1/START domain
MTKSMISGETAAACGETIIERMSIAAPAERVFAALVDPQQRVQWWGGEGMFRTTHMESDLRVGGTWLQSGTGRDGQPFTIRGEYRVIERPRVLAFTWLPSWQADAQPSLVRFDLEERDGVTAVRLTHSGLTPQARQIHRGWPQILGWLAAYLTPAAAP